MGNVQDTQTGDSPNQNGNLIPSRPAPSPVYPSLSDGDHDYEILRPGSTPSRPAPPAPRPPVDRQISTHTMSSSFHALDGVPFIVNPKFLNSSTDRVGVERFEQLWEIYWASFSEPVPGHKSKNHAPASERLQL